MAAQNADTPVWLITGCSTGFGLALARRALALGHHVAATARDRAAVEGLVAATPLRGMALALDVTDPEQVADAVAETERRFGRVDVLVNNAGYGYLSAIEEGEDEEIRAMFETNFFGLVAMTKAVLPGMRLRRSGHVINITSMGGLVANPGSGFYAATKFAVEAVTESLAKEVAPLGIRVTAVEPGPFRTDWAGRSLRQTATPIAAYQDTAGARRASIAGYSGQQPGDPERAVQAIIDIALAAEPPLNLLLGKIALNGVRAKLAGLAEEFTKWESVTLGADFPEGE